MDSHRFPTISPFVLVLSHHFTLFKPVFQPNSPHFFDAMCRPVAVRQVNWLGTSHGMGFPWPGIETTLRCWAERPLNSTDDLYMNLWVCLKMGYNGVHLQARLFIISYNRETWGKSWYIMIIQWILGLHYVQTHMMNLRLRVRFIIEKQYSVISHDWSVGLELGNWNLWKLWIVFSLPWQNHWRAIPKTIMARLIDTPEETLMVAIHPLGVSIQLKMVVINWVPVPRYPWWLLIILIHRKTMQYFEY